MGPTNDRLRAFLAIGAAIAIGSVAFTLLKIVLEDLSPIAVAAGRVVFSAMTFVVVVTSQPWRRRPIERRDRAKVVFCGLGGSAVFHILFSWGQNKVNVAAAGIVLATMPALVAVGEAFFFGHRLRPRQGFGLALSVLGVAVVSMGTGGSGRTSLTGLMAVGMATVMWAAVTLVTRGLTDRYDSWWLNTPGTVMGAGVMLVLAVPHAHEFGRLDVGGWLILAWLGVVSSAFIYFAMAHTMKVLPATTTASLATLVTPLSIIVAWVHLSERPNLGAVIGAISAVVGVVFVTRSATPVLVASD